MVDKYRWWMLFFAVIAILAMLLLSGGISALEFLPGQRLPFGQEGFRANRPIPPLIMGDWLIDALRIMFLILAILFPISLIYILLSPEARKQFFRDLVQAASLCALIYFLAQSRLVQAPRMLTEDPINTDLSSLEESSVPDTLAEFVASPPAWLTTLVSFGVALIIALLIVGPIWFILRQKRKPEGALERIIIEAQEALDTLHAGGDLRDVVIRCYFEMSRILNEQRGIQRKKAMTPREFERHLKDVGLPGEPVHHLTRLFEDVRYGDLMPGRDEEELAVSSLAAIIEAAPLVK